MTAFTKPELRLPLLLVLLGSLWYCTGAQAWTPGLADAARAVAEGRATPQQEWFVYVNNKEINQMALDNLDFQRNVYQKCQNKFFQKHIENLDDAAQKAGLRARVNPPSKIDPQTGEYIFNPGTDTDVDVVPANPGEQLDLDRIKAVEDNFQDTIRRNAAKDGYRAPDGQIDTDTDFLPNPDHTSDADFEAITSHINNNGGTAYTTKDAARAQFKLGSDAPIHLDEAMAFSDDMKDLAQTKFNKAADLRKKAAALRSLNPDAAAKLDAAAQLYDSQGAKYVDRMHQMTNNLRTQNGLPPNVRNITGLDGAVDTINLAGRGAQTAREAAIVAGLKDHAIQKASELLIDTFSDIAKVDPSQSADLAKAIARELSFLPPANQGSMIQHLDSTLDSDLTRRVVQETRRLNEANRAARAAAGAVKPPTTWDRVKTASGIEGMTTFKVAMIAGSAILMGKTGYDISIQNVKPTDTEWDWMRNMMKNSLWYGSGIGSAYEQAEKEELDRLAKAYASGEDPSLSKHVTLALLKTGAYMGQDAIIGLLYLPDHIGTALSWTWGEVTGTNKINAYTAAQNEIAAVMRRMILERKEFNKALAMVKDMGVADADAQQFLNCLCARCGGSLGGAFAPAAKAEWGVGPCICYGPLSIWKAPAPSGRQTQLACFNSVTASNYAQDQAIFEQWRKDALDANATSAEPHRKEMMVMADDPEQLSEAADLFERLEPLLYPKDIQAARAKLGKALSNRMQGQIERGEMIAAVADAKQADRVAGQTPPSAQQVRQMETWKENWDTAKQERFSEIRSLLDAKQLITAGRRVKELHQLMRVTPNRTNFLPPAYHDPKYTALIQDFNAQQQAYERDMMAIYQQSGELVSQKDPRAAVQLLTDTLAEWEHTDKFKSLFNTELATRLTLMVENAENDARRGNALLEQNQPTEALGVFNDSLRVQEDPDVRAKFDALVSRREQAREYRDRGEQHRAKQELAAALRNYEASVKLWPDAYLTRLIQSLKEQTSPGQPAPEPTSPIGHPIDSGSPSAAAPARPLTLASLAGIWDINANNYKGTLTVQSGGSAVLYLAAHKKEEPLTDVRFDSSTQTLTFTRPISKTFKQVYVGTVQPDGSLKGTFTTGYHWSATRRGGAGVNPPATTPSPIANPIDSGSPSAVKPARPLVMEELAGVWEINANGYKGTLTVRPGGSSALYFEAHKKVEPLTDVSFNASTKTLTFTRPISKTFKQVYIGTVQPDGSLKGTFTTGYHWSATRRGGSATRSESDRSSDGFAGTWKTNFGSLEIVSNGATVTGQYPHDKGRIEGRLSADGRTLHAAVRAGAGDQKGSDAIECPACGPTAMRYVIE